MNPLIPEYSVTVMGDGAVGKTSLTIRMITDNFMDEYDPTIEDAYEKELIIDNENISLKVLDTSGQEEFDTLQDQW
eukprot:CAMPEP_0114663572 /NCGR_PEP_ID=MMETSP0191-20121206/27134_1 /TAXON_ID=126664 /ORGANISM="Sorites sp." /LENGTH=75 /DNA_ID=CAMNT_0001903233 /DNA_START=461 /DNA_END=685 /DNA_ORIENTATION=-